MFRDRVDRLQYLRGQVPTCSDIPTMLEWANADPIECKLLICASCKTLPKCLLCRDIYQYMLHMNFAVSDEVRAELCGDYKRLLEKYGQCAYGPKQMLSYQSLQIMEQNEEVAEFCAYMYKVCDNLRRSVSIRLIRISATVVCNWMLNKQLRDIVVALILKYGLSGCMAKLCTIVHLLVSLCVDWQSSLDCDKQ